ncbi:MULTISPECIES: hypothetical protein [Amycolatopsis]|uniref:hypothetical protein n=1 Tax=Amycolatopsis sp. cg13 TaxID=3238807 RepID=UPI003525B477
MLEAFVILGGVVIVLLAVGLVVVSKDAGRKASRDTARPEQRTGAQRGYLFLDQPWS